MSRRLFILLAFLSPLAFQFSLLTSHLSPLTSQFILPILHLCPKQGAFRNLSCTASCTLSGYYLTLETIRGGFFLVFNYSFNFGFDARNCWFQCLEPRVPMPETNGSSLWHQSYHPLEHLLCDLPYCFAQPFQCNIIVALSARYSAG